MLDPDWPAILAKAERDAAAARVLLDAAEPPGACCCMGPQDDDPDCPCAMAWHFRRRLQDIIDRPAAVRARMDRGTE